MQLDSNIYFTRDANLSEVRSTLGVLETNGRGGVGGHDKVILYQKQFLGFLICIYLCKGSVNVVRMVGMAAQVVAFFTISGVRFDYNVES